MSTFEQTGELSPALAARRLGPTFNLFGVLRRGIVYLLLTAAAFVSGFPFFWMIVSSTNTAADVLKGKASFGDALWANIVKLFTQVDVPRVFGNSAFLAIVGTLLTLAISSLAGYGFEMFRSRIREKIFGFLLLMLSIPFAALMVPLFIMMANLKLINTYTAILLPTIASIFMIFYFRQATKAFPSELRDAARIDGLKEWQIFLHVYLPVMRSTYAAAIIIVFMANWNNYLWPLIVLQTNEQKTITLVIQSLASAYYPDFGVVMVGTILATLPTLIIFFVLQRRFVEGMLGAVK
jgi:lactose/L-arabinose transport system permease protein